MGSKEAYASAQYWSSFNNIIDDVTAGVESIETDFNNVEGANVYDLSGRCVIVNVSADRINDLNKGIYIVNGKKVLVK
ncbi:MAG: hypothetical protein J1F20_08405 [Muribaculaceae bacterium]|nr:hypothetical protein [Muribaculaceae bacterium]